MIFSFTMNLPHNFYCSFQKRTSFLWNSARKFPSVIKNAAALTRSHVISPKLVNRQHTDGLGGLCKKVTDMGLKSCRRRRAVSLHIACLWFPTVLKEKCLCAWAEGRRNNRKCWGG